MVINCLKASSLFSYDFCISHDRLIGEDLIPFLFSETLTWMSYVKKLVLKIWRTRRKTPRGVSALLRRDPTAFVFDTFFYNFCIQNSIYSTIASANSLSLSITVKIASQKLYTSWSYFKISGPSINDHLAIFNIYQNLCKIGQCFQIISFSVTMRKCSLNWIWTNRITTMSQVQTL